MGSSTSPPSLPAASGGDVAEISLFNSLCVAEAAAASEGEGRFEFGSSLTRAAGLVAACGDGDAIAEAKRVPQQCLAPQSETEFREDRLIPGEGTYQLS